MDNDGLGRLFSVFGEVEDSYIIRSNQSSKFKQSAKKYGYVIFVKEIDAAKAIEAKKLMH